MQQLTAAMDVQRNALAGGKSLGHDRDLAWGIVEVLAVYGYGFDHRWLGLLATKIDRTLSNGKDYIVIMEAIPARAGLVITPKTYEKPL
jgi:hypothetical protein